MGATLGVVESVLSLLRDEGVTHLGCATDHVIWSWRNERYPDYKTDEGMPPELCLLYTSDAADEYQRV